MFFSVLRLLCLCDRLFIRALWSPAGKGLTSWLSFVVSDCKFVTFPLVSWVRYGTWLYRFLMFAPLLTSMAQYHWCFCGDFAPHLLHWCCDVCQCWPQNVNNYEWCLKYLNFGFEVTKNIQNGAEWPFTTNSYFVSNIYKAVCLQNRVTIGILMLAVCPGLVVTA